MKAKQETIQKLREVVDKLLEFNASDANNLHCLVFIGGVKDMTEKDLPKNTIAIGDVIGIAMGLHGLAQQSTVFKNALKVATGLTVNQENPVKGEALGNLLDIGLIIAQLTSLQEDILCDCPNCVANRAARKEQIKSNPNIN